MPLADLCVGTRHQQACACVQAAAGSKEAREWISNWKDGKTSGRQSPGWHGCTAYRVKGCLVTAVYSTAVYGILPFVCKQSLKRESAKNKRLVYHCVTPICLRIWLLTDLFGKFA